MSFPTKKPRIEVVCIGTELLSARANTHAAYLGEVLSHIGLDISREHTVPDDEIIMGDVFREIWRRADVVISCGGLGPTFDDITREIWSRVTHRPLKIQAALVDDIRHKFKRRGLMMPPHNRRQGMVLRGADVIANSNGTAPGQFLQVGHKLLILLPGPARELKPMVEKNVLPRLQNSFAGHHLRQTSFHFIGIPESMIDNEVRPWLKKYPRILGCPIIYGILASQAVVSFKFTIQGKNHVLVEKASERLEKIYRILFKNRFFGMNKDNLSTVTGKLLREKKWSLAVAESCTGGLLSKMLTDEAGASDFFVEGVTTYSNKSKQKRLGVRATTLKLHGAVSEETAREMARGLRKKTGADVSLSITGIAGPAGGSADKPVGLVYIGCSTRQRTLVQKYNFSGDRSVIRQRAALMALELLRKELLRGR